MSKKQVEKAKKKKKKARTFPIGNHRGYEPSPEEIQKACWKIQDGWTDDEEKRRRVVKDPEVIQLDEYSDPSL